MTRAFIWGEHSLDFDTRAAVRTEFAAAMTKGGELKKVVYQRLADKHGVSRITIERTVRGR